MQTINLLFDSGCEPSDELRRILTMLTQVNERQERLMKLTKDQASVINQKLDQLKSALAMMQNRVHIDFDYLRTRLNEGEQITQSDMDALEAKFNSILSDVSRVDLIPDIPPVGPVDLIPGMPPVGPVDLIPDIPPVEPVDTATTPDDPTTT